MKKSTIIFIGGNLIILIIPILLMLGLRFKINAGDFIDEKAEKDAQIHLKMISEIENIELNSKERRVTVKVFLDSVNQISIDTFDYRYIRYKIVDKTLTIDYDYDKDILENPKTNNNENMKRRSYDNTYRTVRLFVNNSLKSIKIRDGDVDYKLSEKTLQNSNMEIVSENGNFSLIKSNRNNDYEYESYPDDDYSDNSFDSIPHEIKASIVNSELNMKIDYIKSIKIKAKDSNINIGKLDFDNYDLLLDENTSTLVDISKLRKMKISYMK